MIRCLLVLPLVCASLLACSGAGPSGLDANRADEAGTLTEESVTDLPAGDAQTDLGISGAYAMSLALMECGCVDPVFEEFECGPGGSFGGMDGAEAPIAVLQDGGALTVEAHRALLSGGINEDGAFHVGMPIPGIGAFQMSGWFESSELFTGATGVFEVAGVNPQNGSDCWAAFDMRAEPEA